ncbi:FCD domain-containing protein [Paracoccus sp. TK19116]|uniref:FCD domain-containing protein n=1 Tax=Paracoccus albicereus TaxID=2922394 RepID=A0ABT1MUF9_9RHOB|nr:FCD domain-containing protein [Paracoccus albicereus]MCQ0971106.1 FCD domain-containing protein [Paracoccus albicereus]
MATENRARATQVLEGLIGSGEFGPGARLPPERELSARLQVNRATLRKLLTRLEFEGRITRHVGRGTFVADKPDRTPDLSATSSPIELMDARLLLEPVIAREAAVRARSAELDAMEDLLVRFEAAEDYGEFEHLDILFHEAVARATQSSILQGVDAMLRNLRCTPEWDRLKRASFSADTRALYRREHRAILNALSERDAAAAGQAMERHVASIHRRLIRMG